MHSVSVTLTNMWWDEGAQKDVKSDCVFVTLWARTGGSTGSSFEHTCHNKEELWEYLGLLMEDRLKVLKDEFGYTPPSGAVQLPADLNELFL